MRNLRNDDRAAMDPNLMLLAIIALVALGIAITMGVTLTSLPGYVIMAGLAVLALFIMTKFGGLTFGKARGPTRFALVAMVLAVVVLVVAPALPAIENIAKEPENRAQDVLVKGYVFVNHDVPGADEADISGVSVDWKDSRMAAFSFHPFCAWWSAESDEITVNARLQDNAGVQEDYAESVVVGKFCGSSDSAKPFEIILAGVEPSEYTLYLSATNPKDGSIAEMTYGTVTIQHRSGA